MSKGRLLTDMEIGEVYGQNNVENWSSLTWGMPRRVAERQDAKTLKTVGKWLRIHSDLSEHAINLFESGRMPELVWVGIKEEELKNYEEIAEAQTALVRIEEKLSDMELVLTEAKQAGRRKVVEWIKNHKFDSIHNSTFRIVDSEWQGFLKEDEITKE